MDFILQNEIYYKIVDEIRTPTGRKSPDVLNVKYFYVIHRLNHVRIFEPEEYAAGVPMNYNILAKILMLKTGKVFQILNWLVKNNIIINVKKYSTGRHSNLYKFHPEFENKPIDSLLVSESESRLVQKILNHYTLANFDCKIARHQSKLIKDGLKLSNNAINYIEKAYPDLLIAGEIPYSNLKPKDYFLTQLYSNKTFCRRSELTRRIYSTLTSMPSNMRHGLLLFDKPLIQIDLKNAQILLAVPKIIEWYKNKYGADSILPTDILTFKCLAENGEFYEALARNAGFDISTDKLRNNFKERFFKEIWFSKLTRWDSKLKSSFQKLFPNVWQIINMIKYNDYRVFSIELQKFEALIFIDTVLMELYSQNIPALSLHDCVIVNSVEDLKLVEELLIDVLATYGLTPSFKITGLPEIKTAA